MQISLLSLVALLLDHFRSGPSYLDSLAKKKKTGKLVVSLRTVNCRFWSNLRLVFTRDGVSVGVVIRSVELTF